MEHSAGASFAANPDYFDPENIVRLAIEGGCNAVASTLGVLGAVARKYAHKIPFIVKINHNELLTLPEPVRPDPVRQRRAGLRHGRRWPSGRRSISARRSRTGRSRRSPRPLPRAHEMGLVTILWCYLRNNDFRHDGKNYKRRRT